MTDTVTERVLKIQALAQGGYEHLVTAALNGGSSIDEFGMDLLTEQNREVVMIAEDQNLPAGSILVRAYSSDVTAGSGNTGNGTLVVDAIREDAVEGVYLARCTAAAVDGGIFEVLMPSDGILGEANVGTAFLSGHLNLTIAYGVTDFAVGDTFTIEIIGGEYSGIDFDAAETDPPSVQIAAGVLGVAIDTTETDGPRPQFATVRGPAVLSPSFVQLGNHPWGPTNHLKLIEQVMTTCLAQLRRRGIVVR